MGHPHRRPLGAPLRGHDDGVEWRSAPDGRTLASAGEEGERSGSGTRGRAARGPRCAATRRRLRRRVQPRFAAPASGGTDGTVRARGTPTPTTAGAPLRGHKGAVAAWRSVPTGARSRAAPTTTVRLWDTHTHRRLGAPPPRPTPRRGGGRGCSVPTGARSHRGGADRTVRLWDKPTPTADSAPPSAATAAAKAARWTAVALGPDGRTLASAGADGDRAAVGRPTPTARLHAPFAATQRGFFDVAFSADGRTLASAGRTTETIRVWDVLRGVRTRRAARRPHRGGQQASPQTKPSAPEHATGGHVPGHARPTGEGDASGKQKPEPWALSGHGDDIQ